MTRARRRASAAAAVDRRRRRAAQAQKNATKLIDFEARGAIDEFRPKLIWRCGVSHWPAAAGATGPHCQ